MCSLSSIRTPYQHLARKSDRVMAGSRHSQRARCQAAFNLQVDGCGTIAPSRGELGLVKSLHNMIVQIGIVDDRSGDRVVAEHHGLSEAVRPLLGCEVPLTDPH